MPEKVSLLSHVVLHKKSGMWNMKYHCFICKFDLSAHCKLGYI